MADSDNTELIGFIGSRFEALGDRFETLSDRFEGMREQLGEIKRQMATKEDLARLDGRLSERIDVAVTAIRGNIEQTHLRLDSIEHRMTSRDEHLDGEISRLRSAVYVLGKDRPDVLRLLGHSNS